MDNKKDHFETCYPGVVIAWETTTDPDLPNGYNLWVKGNAAETLEEKNGKFYQKPSIVEAKIISDEFPEFIRGAKISPDGNGWSLVTPWATVSGKYGDIWAKYGVNSKGEVDANIIAVSQTDTVNQYFVCTKEGEVIEPLSEFLKKI